MAEQTLLPEGDSFPTVTINDAMKMLFVSRSKFYRLAEKHKLVGWRIGKSIRFYPQDIRRLFEPVYFAKTA